MKGSVWESKTNLRDGIVKEMRNYYVQPCRFNDLSETLRVRSFHCVDSAVFVLTTT